MSISIFDLFSIGLGPSSSHTVGPMQAAFEFCQLLSDEQLAACRKIKIELYGSLSLTGKGHGTDKAVLLGLENHTPAGIDPDLVNPRFAEIRQQQKLKLANQKSLDFNPETDLIFHQEYLPQHANGMRFSLFDQDNKIITNKVYFSIGGGFIADEQTINQENQDTNGVNVPYPFNTAKELINLCVENNLSIAELMFANECQIHNQSKDEIKKSVLNIANVMQACIERGCNTQGTLPGGLEVRRRAPSLFEKIKSKSAKQKAENHADVMNWLNLYALAVNEENAAGGRIVTAPTNGAAGVIPAVLEYYKVFCAQDKINKDDEITDFLLTAAAIAILYKKGASISAAEVGCQGEVGVACSMAAAALTAVLGGNIHQIENAAEIGMEHNLGLTCDPIGGLVQIPCIERNAMGAVQAVNAAELALMEDGHHKVSLDNVIATMLQTGKDMQNKYKETSQGGLAVNVVEC